jgi:hypothetical protein
VKIEVNGCIGISKCINVNLTGMDVTTAGGLVLYPNPTGNVLRISHRQGRYSHGCILEMIGATVHSFECTGTETEVNISGLNSGIYMVQLWSDDNHVIMEFIKE